LVVFCSSSALALKYEIDGDISDWGVDPFHTWNPSASATADYEEHNGVNRYDAVGYWEAHDYEALYFDDDESYFYFAAVSSYNMSVAGSAGDLMLDVDGDMQISEHGVVTGIDYGLLVADYSWQDRLVTGTERATNRYEFPDGWQGSPYRMVYWEYVGDCITEIAFDASLESSGAYLLEAAIPRNLFGPLGPGDTIGIHLTNYSGRDSINLFGTVDTFPNPEPSTILLLGGGLAGVVAYYTTKRR
jgi:hypothetical protein